MSVVTNLTDKEVNVFLVGSGSFVLKPYEGKCLDREEAWSLIFVTLNQMKSRQGILKFETCDRKLELMLAEVLK